MSDAATTPAGDALRPKVASGVRWGTVDQGVQTVVRFAVLIVLTRLLRPHDFGLMGIVLLVVGLAPILVGLGMSEGLVQRRQIEPRHIAVAFTVTFFSGVGLAVLVAATAGLVARLFSEPRVTPLLVVASVVFLAHGAEQTPNDTLLRAMHFREYHVSSTIATLASAVVAVALAAAGAGVWSLVAMAVTEAVVATALAWAFAVRARVWRPGMAWDRPTARELTGFGAYVTGGRVLAYGRGNGDNFVVAEALGATALGYYALGYRMLLTPVAKVSAVMGATAFSAFAAVQHDIERVAAGLSQANRYMAVVCFPVTAGVAVAAPLLVPVVFGARWLPAVHTVQILALAGPCLCITSLDDAMFRAVGRPAWSLRLGLLDLAFAVPAFVIGSHFGIAGVATGVVIAGYVMVCVQLWVRRQLLGQSVAAQLRPLVPIAIATAVMALATLAARQAVTGRLDDPAALAVVVAVGGAVFVVALHVADPTLLPSALADARRRPA
jgi:O-antigen/teichoic acid export membrane protein